MARVDEERLLALLIKWNRSQLRGKTIGPEELCPDDLTLREALRTRIDQLLRLEGVVEAANAVDRGSNSHSSDRLNNSGVQDDSSNLESTMSKAVVNIVPKGLRSFDEHDSHFFRDLLPGIRDLNGIPDSLRFWKDRIDEPDSKKTFAVGLLFGPSGCGKTSLIRAGLIPSLSSNVITVYVESTPGETERRLLSNLRKHCSGIGKDLGLKKTVAALCGGSTVRREPPRSGGFQPPSPVEIAADAEDLLRVEPRLPDTESTAQGKVLIVLDQFERWLHANNDPDKLPSLELIETLRQCDGQHVQCLVIVRDDFWLPATRFMRELGTRLIDGDNSIGVERFATSHARQVLKAFGRAFGALPHDEAKTSPEQNQFVDAAVRGLAEEGQVLPARLALFAETMKGRPWIPATIDQLVGAEEVGVSFLETTLGGTNAPSIHRAHLKAARAVLKELLPDLMTPFNGRMRSYTELLHVSGYRNRLQEFDELIRILDGELKLITPSDPPMGTVDENVIPFAAGGEVVARDQPEKKTRGDSMSPSEITLQHYQLTHDFLVPSLREWLTRMQSETVRGRAELRLSDRAAMWNARNDTRQLPTLPEFLSIQLLTNRRQWTGLQSRMMLRAGLWHGTRWLRLASLLLLIGFSFQYVTSQRLSDRMKSAVEAVQFASPVDLPMVLSELKRLPRELVQKELGALQLASVGDRRLRVAIGLAEVGAIDVVFLCSQIETASSDEADNLIVALGHFRDASLKEIRTAAAKRHASKSWLFEGRLALVALYLGDHRIASDMCQIENRSDPIQRTCFIEAVTIWPGDVTKLAAFARTTGDRALRSALCLGLTGIAPEKITDEARAAWQPLFVEWFQSAPDGLTRGAAELALFYWDLERPEIAASPPEAEGRNWFLNSVGMVLNRILPNPVSEQTTAAAAVPTDPTSFFLSDREITVAQFGQFFADDSCPDPEKPQESPTFTQTEASYPAHSINWYDAVMFCNWLSRRENLTPCYEKTGTRDVSGNDEWRRRPDATGYRLPTEEQWESACRAGTTTIYSCGDGFVLSRYGNIVGSSLNPCALRFPNGWGLFDMHGNVSEWCDDRRPDSEDNQRLVRGGSWTAPVSSAASVAG